MATPKQQIAIEALIEVGTRVLELNDGGETNRYFICTTFEDSGIKDGIVRFRGCEITYLFLENRIEKSKNQLLLDFQQIVGTAILRSIMFGANSYWFLHSK